MIFCVLVLISNTLLTKPLYHFFTKSSIKSAMDEVKQVDFDQSKKIWFDEISKIEKKSTFEIMVFKEGEFMYASSFQPRMFDFDEIENKSIIPKSMADRRTYNLKELNRALNRKDKDENFVYSIDNNGDYTIVISQFLKPVNSSIKQSNMLLIIITLVITAFAGLYTNKLSKSFTRPIMQIKQNLARLTELDFSMKCEVNTNDELKTLADDINSLAFRLKSTLDELNIKNERLEDDIESQRKFISNASHELRTPLSLIQGYANEIKDGYVKDDDQRDMYLEIINTEAEKMNRLLKDMLELSRMQSGSMEFIMQKMSVKTQVCTFVNKYDGFIMDNDLNMSFDFDDKEDIGYFDELRFEQVLANYISNAAKYCDDKKIVKISTQVFEDRIRINVYNSGKCMDEKTLKDIWNRFYKGNEKNDNVHNSYGLGLSIVYAIQKTLKQKCGVENMDGGICFWFEVGKTG